MTRLICHLCRDSIHPSDTSGDTTQVRRFLDLSHMRIVIKAESQARVHLCAFFRPGRRTKHG